MLNRAYPRAWRRDDPQSAVSVLRAAVSPPSPLPGRGEQLVFEVDRYPAQLSAWQERRRRWVECEFTVPPSWPWFTLIQAPDGTDDRPPASSGEIVAGWVRLPDVAGRQLWTPDAAHTRQLFADGLAAAVAAHPLARLRIGSPSASLRSDYGARLNAESASWALGLIRAVLRGAPPYESLGLIDMAPGIAWTQQHLDRDLGPRPPDEEG